MSKNSVESKVMYLPKEAFTKKGFFDSDGPNSTENTKDDVDEMEKLKQSYEPSKDEGKAYYIDKELNTQGINFLAKKLGRSIGKVIGFEEKSAA